ncbi:hypothetical protein HZH68_013365 [Vespula germanica]|uniref:Uncharacterized protein n=1 Tax=Vespula germanica TaxID=30212 RepID=A0A834JCQ0_VESGE|nr:hypothetical protein HZH68_013365 [Vespula germanica]
MTMEGTLCEKRSRCYSTIHPCHLVVTFVNTIGRTSTMDMGYATDGNDQPPDPIGPLFSPVHAAGAGADADTGAGTGTGTGTGAIGRAGSTVSATATATVVLSVQRFIS